MNISPEGVALLKHFEGLRLKAYRDAVGVWTIGYGSTGQHVRSGLSITAPVAEALLLEDLERFEEGVIQTLRDTGCDYPSQNQFDALVCFTFNLGLGAWRKSTMLKRLIARDYAGAADQFLRWDKAGGKTLLGLTRRRRAERALFLGDSL